MVARISMADASAPHRKLPTASPDCSASRLIDTALARTHAGAVLCVPAERLARTPTQAAPASSAPTSATPVTVVAATSSVAPVQSRMLARTTVLSEYFCSCSGIASARDDGAGAEGAVEQPVAARPQAELVARDQRDQRPERARADGEADVEDHQRAHRRRMAREAQAALHTGEQRLRHARQVLLDGLEAAHAEHHDQEEQRACQQRAAGAEPGGDRAGDGRARWRGRR